jgi:hypothetical protein
VRESPLLYEKDGDFNPGWLLFIVFAAAGLLGSAVACMVALRNERAWPAAVAAMIFCATAMLITAVIVVPIARAKLLAPSIGAGMRAMGAAAGGDTPADYETLADRGASE